MIWVLVVLIVDGIRRKMNINGPDVTGLYWIYFSCMVLDLQVYIVQELQD